MISDMNLIDSLINQIPVITPIFIGACAIFHNGKMAQRRATIDVILQENNNVTLQESKFLIYTKYQNKPLIDLYRDRENEDRKRLITVLNRYEFIAHGIRSKSFNESIYKNMQYTSIINLWGLACPMIMELRREKGNETAYQELEWLGKRWRKKPLKKCNKL